MHTVPTKPPLDTSPKFRPVFGDAREVARADDATRNNLVRAELKQRDRRFTGEPITTFGALA